MTKNRLPDPQTVLPACRKTSRWSVFRQAVAAFGGLPPNAKIGQSIALPRFSGLIAIWRKTLTV
ncbi:MAG: hypothetical protein NC203_11760, partial [Firmicutes bacterium]|nr:hypothetical protein [Bacillota bacterium]